MSKTNVPDNVIDRDAVLIATYFVQASVLKSIGMFVGGPNWELSDMEYIISRGKELGIEITDEEFGNAIPDIDAALKLESL